jgi:hypothetical protein
LKSSKVELTKTRNVRVAVGIGQATENFQPPYYVRLAMV